jgi:phosphatidate phosphatase APP1
LKIEPFDNILISSSGSILVLSSANLMQKKPGMLKPVFSRIRKPFKRIKVYLKQKAGWLDVPKILPYRGFGNKSEVYINGMVIEDKGLTKPQDKQKVWKNILAAVKRFASDEIAGVKVKASFLGITQITETDEQGYFSFHFKVDDKATELQSKEWHQVHFELKEDIVKNQPHVYATGDVRIIRQGQQRIFVSDIDDTVLISHSTQTFKKLRLMLFKNALTRHPFPGVPAFYRALSIGKNSGRNPFFYVSSSEWNLYDLLEDFFHFNRIPKGVFMLRKLNHSIYEFWKSGKGSHEHKYEKISFLINFYKNQKFVLIGDSGQKDPLIYRRLALNFPGRIETIYIRQIGKKSFFRNVREIQSELKKVNTDYLEVKDTAQASKHALSRGYIIEKSMQTDKKNILK